MEESRRKEQLPKLKRKQNKTKIHKEVQADQTWFKLGSNKPSLLLGNAKETDKCTATVIEKEGEREVEDIRNTKRSNHYEYGRCFCKVAYQINLNYLILKLR